MGKFTPGNFDLSVRRSYAGLGLVANEAIPKGACVIEYWGRQITKEEENTSRSKYLFAISDKKTIDGQDRKNIARYINHSCRPNCEPEIYRGRVFILAKRSIKAGEELCYDYGKEYFDAQIKPHGCRCVKCRPDLSRHG
ncbi:MAG: SET domain-containing protein [Hyphomonadaceae bacterium]